MYDNNETNQTRMAARNAAYLANRKKSFKVSTVLIWVGLLVAAVVLWETAPSKVIAACKGNSVTSNLCK